MNSQPVVAQLVKPSHTTTHVTTCESAIRELWEQIGEMDNRATHEALMQRGMSHSFSTVEKKAATVRSAIGKRRTGGRPTKEAAPHRWAAGRAPWMPVATIGAPSIPPIAQATVAAVAPAEPIFAVQSDMTPSSPVPPLPLQPPPAPCMGLSSPGGYWSLATMASLPPPTLQRQSSSKTSVMSASSTATVGGNASLNVKSITCEEAIRALWEETGELDNRDTCEALAARGHGYSLSTVEKKAAVTRSAIGKRRTGGRPPKSVAPHLWPAASAMPAASAPFAPAIHTSPSNIEYVVVRMPVARVPILATTVEPAYQQ